MTENSPPQPEDPYGISKYAVELDLRNAHEMFGLDYVILRPHNVNLVCIRDGASLGLSVTTPVRIKAAINTGMASIANFSDLANTNPNTLGEVADVAFRLVSPDVGGDRDLVLGADSFYVIRSAPGVNGLLETSTVALPGHTAPIKAFGAHLQRLEAMIRMLNESAFNTTMAARPFNPAQFK